MAELFSGLATLGAGELNVGVVGDVALSANKAAVDLEGGLNARMLGDATVSAGSVSLSVDAASAVLDGDAEKDYYARLEETAAASRKRGGGRRGGGRRGKRQRN